MRQSQTALVTGGLAALSRARRQASAERAHARIAVEAIRSATAQVIERIRERVAADTNYTNRYVADRGREVAALHYGESLVRSHGDRLVAELKQATARLDALAETVRALRQLAGLPDTTPAERRQLLEEIRRLREELRALEPPRQAPRLMDCLGPPAPELQAAATVSTAADKGDEPWNS